MTGGAAPSRPARRRLLGVAAGVALAASVSAVLSPGLRCSSADLAQAREGTARAGADGTQEIALVAERGEYRPNVVHARAGAPLRLRVLVHEGGACARRLLVPDLHAALDLPDAGSTELLLPAAARGSYLFTCEGRMVKGVLVLD